MVRQSPFRRRQLAGIEAYAQLSDPLDHASRNLRVLARRCAVALWRGEEVPAPYRVQMGELAEVMRFMATELRNARLPVRARDRLVAIGEATSHVGLTDSISAVVILAQVRSITADLLELTGIDYAEARALIPRWTDQRWRGPDLRSAGTSPMVGHCRRGVEQLGSSLGS